MARVAAKFGVTASAVHRHRKHAAAPAPLSVLPPRELGDWPPPGTKGVGAFAARDLDAYEVTVETIDTLRQTLASDIVQVDPTVVAKVATALTSATRLHARLSGQLEISQAMIIRSRPWKDLKAIFDRVLARHPLAARELAEELARAEGEG